MLGGVPRMSVIDRTCRSCRISLDRFASCPYCEQSIEIFRNGGFALKIDGDWREKHWAQQLNKRVPSYEEFWKIHIIPLTGRLVNPTKKLIRPGLSNELYGLADGSYAAMFHLTQLLSVSKADGGTLKPSSVVMYSFFSHVRSLLDSLVGFAAAVDMLLERYQGRKPFDVTFKNRRWPDQIRTWHDRAIGDCFDDLLEKWRRCRNILVHRKPVFPINGRIPKPGYFDEWSGLAAKGKVQENPEILKEAFEEIDVVFAGILEQASRIMEGVWAQAMSSANALWSENQQYREDQRKGC